MANTYDSSKPKYEWGTGWTKGGITEKQASYVATLAQKASITITGDLSGLNKGKASGLIDELKRAATGDPHSMRYLKRYTSLSFTQEA